MFCSNCGQQIPDNTKFCNHCGASQQIVKDTESAPKTTENQQKVADTPTQKDQKAPKKKSNIIVVLAVVLCAFLIRKFLIAPSMSSDPGNGDNPSGQGNQSQQLNGNGGGVPSAAYNAIFDDTYIVHFQAFSNMDMKSFALKTDDGMIYCADFGYKDDIVKEWVETLYIPVSDLTDTEKEELESIMKEEYEEIEDLNCCSITYKMSTNYFTITITFSDVDEEDNYEELYDADLVEEKGPISMSETEDSYLDQGYVKK